MVETEACKLLTIYIPKPWIPLIDKHKDDVSQAEWIRVAIRDRMVDEGIFLATNADPRILRIDRRRGSTK